MSEESFIREVDEAVRQERFKSLWNKYGLYLILGVVAIVGSVAGYKGWTYWQTQQANEAGARFIGALNKLGSGNTGEAQQIFQSLANGGPSGYSMLARFQLAALHAEQGRRDEAVKIYEELASSSGLSKVLRDFATIRAAMLRLDEASFADMKERLEPLAVAENPWRHSARELLGLSAYRADKTGEAERYFNAMLSDSGTPQSMRQRAEMMLALTVQAKPAEAAVR